MQVRHKTQWKGTSRETGLTHKLRWIELEDEAPRLQQAGAACPLINEGQFRRVPTD